MKRTILFLIPTIFLTGSFCTNAQREVKLLRHEVLMIIGAEGGFNSNVGDIGIRADYYPTQQLGLGIGIGTAFGVPRWTVGMKAYIGDPIAGFYFFGAYSGNPKRDGVEIKDVEFKDEKNQIVKQNTKVDIQALSTINAGIGIQFILFGPINGGVYAGYMFPLKRRDDAYSFGNPNTQWMTTPSGVDTIVSEVPAGMMIGVTLGFTLFN